MSSDTNPAKKTVLNVPIARFTTFILWMCGGASYTTVLLFCNIRFNAADDPLSIMFHFVACPAFAYVLYKTSYACNMSASLLVLMGSTKFDFFKMHKVLTCTV